MDSKKGSGGGLIKPGGDRYGYMGHFRAPSNVKEGHNVGAPRSFKTTQPNYGGGTQPKPGAGGSFKPVAPKVAGGQLRGKNVGKGMKGPKAKGPKMSAPKAPAPAKPQTPVMAAPKAPKPATITPPIASRPTMSAPMAPKAPTMSTPTLQGPSLGGLLTPALKPRLR